MTDDTPPPTAASDASEGSIWDRLRAHTAARIGLGRTGYAEPLAASLRFRLAHAHARDAVYATLDAVALSQHLGTFGLGVLAVQSQAPDRRTYLQRPDLGRRLDTASTETLQGYPATSWDVVCVVADGLSATAANRHAAPLLAHLLPHLDAAGLRVGPFVLATQARVALADDVGTLLGARLSLIVLGERPGLSAPDSLGAYLTYAPQPGLTDERRNCVSNIRPEGLPYDQAAATLAYLIREALRRKLSGVALKDDAAAHLPGAPPRVLDAGR